nr:mitochondrial uncoupling protein 5-like [Tanacetum cinerariifolium]
MILAKGVMKDGLGTHVTASFTLGFVAAILSNPMDVINTRFMNMKVATGVEPQYKWAVDSAVNTVKAERQEQDAQMTVCWAIYNRDGLTLSEFMKGDTYFRDRKNTKGHITGLTCGEWQRMVHCVYGMSMTLNRKSRLCDMCRTRSNYVKKVCQRAGTNILVEMNPVFSELKLNVLMMMMIAGKRYYGNDVDLVIRLHCEKFTTFFV